MKRTIIVYFFSFILLICNVYSQHSQWKSYTDGNIVTELAVEGESVWIGTSASGLAYLDHPDGSLIYYNTDNSDLPDNRIKSIAIDHEGMKWIGAKNGGVSKFDGENWTIYNLETSDISGDRAEAIAFDNDGNMWVGFKSNGLCKFDGNNWIAYTMENSDLPMNQVNCIAFDDSNTKWIGCDHFGIAKFDDQKYSVNT
jgi:ligand-binding sensor domain-containing protein